MARCVLGNTESSGQIERDFGRVGDVTPGRRSRLDCAFVDLILCLNSNFECVATIVRKVSSEKKGLKWKEMVSKWFTGVDAEDLSFLDAYIENICLQTEGSNDDLILG